MDDQFTEWHSVRPWHPTLSLAVREITSVSVTFILSCPYSATDASNPDPTSLGLSSSDEDDQSRDSVTTTDSGPTQVVADILSKGLSVKVNGTPWQRVFLKMDEVFDEGIIILYGLMPARQYDIEMGLSPGQTSTSVRGQITTDTEARSETALPDADPVEPAANPSDAAMSSSIPLSTAPGHANGAHTTTPAPAQFTLEDRRLQLTHTLSLLNAEHSTLTSSLKSARKESQKADAALRSEIDTLKRASDRYAAGESRARQKILALQQAVKQTLAAARDIEELIKDIEAKLPELEKDKANLEKEWVQVKEEAEHVRARREEAERREKARAESMQSELAGLVNRLDKLTGKREKLEGDGGVLAELEDKLRKLEEERERIERDPYGYEGEAAAESEDGSRTTSDGRSKDDSSPEGERTHALPARHPNQPHGPPPPHLNNFHPHQHQHHVHPRKRHSNPHMHNQPHVHHHPRPSFPPPRSMGHPEPAHRPAGRASFPMGANTVPGVIHLPSHGNPGHRKANHPHRGGFHAHPHPHPHPQAGGSGSGSSSASPTPVPSSTPGGASNSMNAGSNLSGRAPAFDPTRSRAHSQSTQGTPQVPAKSELNPGSTPFAPRTAVAQAVAPTASTSGKAGSAS
ncbi:hypothetical protein BV20DRAFT_965450 [Pilatotrama ljubarskyi]|nr:hypothetical protein BV20DRAFT_965450 [Pilatotrama ljubarskyi]